MKMSHYSNVINIIKRDLKKVLQEHKLGVLFKILLSVLRFEEPS